MSPARPLARHEASTSGVPSIVVVDPRFDIYGELVAAARAGTLDVHLRSSGAEALRLNRHLAVDAWLVAADLDDMSGHDLVELLKIEAAESKVAMVIDSPDGRRGILAACEATEAGADGAVAKPISLADLQQVLGIPVGERARVLGGAGSRKPFVTLPVGVGAAVIAIAVLMMG
jgi:CheY-like chemotaxis protein